MQNKELHSAQCISSDILLETVYISGSQRIHDQFPGGPWIHFYDGYSEVYLFF